MKIKDIKTRTKLLELADIWYQRSHKLRKVWQSTKETPERKERALTLWLILHSRIMILTKISNKMYEVNPDDYEIGGVIL